MRRFASCLAILIAACGDRPARLPVPVPGDSGVHADAAPPVDGSEPDSGVVSPDGGDAQPNFDATPIDSGLPRPDAGPYMCRNQDAGARPDTTGDRSLAGTSLENTAILWREPLELCNEWREGRSFDQERANEVHVTLHPSPRDGLGQAELTAAWIDRGTIRRGLNSDQIWILEDQPRTSRVIEWTVREPQGNTLLNAAIEHDFGEAGVLTERLSVGRLRNTPRDVDYNADTAGGEVAFFWLPRGAAPDDVILLGPCDGGPTNYLENALEVVAAGDATRSVTVVRKLRTSLALAGSAPVYLQGARTILSDRPGEMFLAAGPFSQTYAAEHHNWNEHSFIDYTLDPVVRESVLDRLSAGEPAALPFIVENVDLVGLSAFGQPPVITVRTFDTTTMQYDSFSPNATGVHWARVDETALLRELRGPCANASVGSIGDYEGNTLLQLVTCAGNGVLGFDVLGAVPVIFNGDPSHVGERITGAAIVERNGALEIAVGTWTVRISVSAPNVFNVSVRDPQGMERASAVRSLEPFDVFLPEDELVEAENGDVRLSFSRRRAGQAPGQSTLFTPMHFQLDFNGCTHRVEAFDRMHYQSSHHNWNDTFTAETDTLRMIWRIGFDRNEMTEHRVRAEQLVDGAEVLPETVVTVTR